MIDVLGMEEGGPLAAKYARDGCYGKLSQDSSSTESLKTIFHSEESSSLVGGEQDSGSSPTVPLSSSEDKAVDGGWWFTKTDDDVNGIHLDTNPVHHDQDEMVDPRFYVEEDDPNSPNKQTQDEQADFGGFEVQAEVDWDGEALPAPPWESEGAASTKPGWFQNGARTPRMGGEPRMATG